MGLSRLGYPIWFDEYSLKPGDRLRESIEAGIKDCRKCILVLTPHFLANKGWGATEFNAIFTREILEEQSLVVPVWAGVTKAEVFAYCPSLANVLGVNWTDQREDAAIREIARGIEPVI